MGFLLVLESNQEEKRKKKCVCVEAKMKTAPSKAASEALACKQGLWLLQGGVQERCQTLCRWHPPPAATQLLPG